MRRFTNSISFCSLLIGIISVSCSSPEKRFTKLSSARTGITFSNNLKPSGDLNIFNYLYFFNGGGVAAGDLNGDDLPDLIFTSNQGRNKLYLNLGDMRFKDISDRLAEAERPNKWTTGVSMVDVNQDGLLDIYVCEVGSYLKIEGDNKLYINQGNDESGIPSFKQEAKKFGLDLVGFSTQASFFDYDLDGDLDMYQLNHSVHSNGTFGKSDIRNSSHPLAGDRLMRNDNGRFTDVTQSAGIYNSPLGYGLGIGISDINNDGYPDIYIGNDFHEDDYLYINQGDGTFKESLEQMIRHTSRFSMGNDLADINNDGLIDILSLDMLPRDYQMLKASGGEDSYDVYQYKLKFGYKDQHARNTLQLNRGNNKFSEIGLLSGIAATDWSWSGLVADFDLDGMNDIFVANGIVGRTNDLDYINFISNDAIQYRLEGDMSDDELVLTEKMPKVLIPNYAFKNNGDLTFEDVSSEWGLNQPTFSNGAIYVDLDLDGDLEIVTNNIDQEASIYLNNTLEQTPSANYLKMKFAGPDLNPKGVGVKVTIPFAETTIIRELYPVRGYQSTLSHSLHIGLDSIENVDQIRVEWPDGKAQLLRNVPSNQTILVSYSDASLMEDDNLIRTPQPNPEDISATTGVKFEHRENNFVEFHRESLIPYMISAEGPAYAQGDLNGDGLDDLFFGGAKHQPSYIYIQLANGQFEEQKLQEDSVYEDVDAKIADFDNDGDNDLIVLSGGNEFFGESDYLRPRLYLNGGGGSLQKDVSAFSNLYVNGSKLAIADVDDDNDLDIFIGARSTPRTYGIRPQSYLMINDNGGFTSDPSFDGDLGMVVDAEWGDLNLDNTPDLVLATDWETIKVLYNNGGSFRRDSVGGTSGLWRCIQLYDINHDGRMDILGGNFGLNSKFTASREAPLRMYVKDFDDNGSIEQILTTFRDGKEGFFATKDELTGQMVSIKKAFTDYTSFSRANLYDVIPRQSLEQSLSFAVEELRSIVLINQENGFVLKPLPLEAQISPTNDFLVYDFNNDDFDDVLTLGNFSRANVEHGQFDAGMGELFINDEAGRLTFSQNSDLGLYIDGEVRQADIIQINGRDVVVVVRNNDTPKFIALDEILN